MKNIVIALCLTALMLGVAPESKAALIDFETLYHDDGETIGHGASYMDQGFLFTNTATEESSGFSPSLATFGAQAPGYAGSTMLFNDNYDGQTVLSKVDGGLFTLTSISLAGLYPAEVPFDVTFTGLLLNGATVAQTFSLDGIAGIQSYLFDDTFTNLVSVSWHQTPDFHQFDNLSVNPVPVPGALLLLGSGLLGVLGLRRQTGL